MALTERLALLITADTQMAIKGLQNLERQADKSLGATEDRSKRLSSGFQKAGVGMIASGGLILGGLLKAAKASEEANLSTVKLQNTLRNMPKLAGENIGQFQKLATAIQGKTAADADAIIEGEALLGTFNLTAQQMKDITPLVVDYARKFGTDIPSAAVQVGKALDGQIGALKRNGVSIDETLYKTDRFTAVQKALADQVGGFAEQEGRTFQGSLERLRNQLGDLEEGVGVGAVDAFTKLIGPLQSVSQWFINLPPSVQETTGSVAAFGATGLIAAGGASALIGQIIKMRDNFSKAGDALDGMSGKLGALGRVGVNATVFTVLGIGIDQLADAIFRLQKGGGANFSKLTEDLVKFSQTGKAGGELAKQFGSDLGRFGSALDRLDPSGLTKVNDAIRKFIPFSGSNSVKDAKRDLDDLDKSLAQLVSTGHADTAKKIFDDVVKSLEGTGHTSGELKGRLNGYTDALARNRTQALLDKDAHHELSAAQDDTTKSTATIADTVGYLTAAFQDNIRAADDRYAALHRGLDLNLDYEQAIDDLEKSLKSNTGTLDAHTQAGRDNIRAVEDAQDAIFQLTKKTFENTGSVDQANTAAELYTQNLANQLTQAGFTETQVKQLIDQIKLTPAQVTTIFSTPGLAEANANVHSLVQGLDALPEAARNTFFGFGSSGHASGLPLDEGVNIVGEGGAEALIKHGNRVNVLTAAQTRNQYGAGGGSMVNITQNFRGQPDPAEAGRAAAREMARQNFLRRVA